MSLELILSTVISNPVIRRSLIASFLLFVSLFLNSCVEGEEEVWINSDGSGRFVAHYQVPVIALKELGDPEVFVEALRKIDEREESIEIMDLYFVKQRGDAIFHLEANFSDVTDLLELAERNANLLIEDAGADPEQIEKIAGSTAFQVDGLTPTFNRSVSLEGLIPKSFKGMLGRSNFKYTMHLPVKVKETNADEISNDGHTVSWTFLLRDHLEAPMEMGFTTELPIPWWLWLVLAILMFTLAWIIWRKLLRPKTQ